MPKTQKVFFLGLVLILMLPAASAWSRETVVVAAQAGECMLSVEADEEWHTLRLRAHHPDYKGCKISKNDMILILAAAFAKTEPPMLKGEYRSLFIGRLIDYPWLSHYLANAAYQYPGWSKKQGKPKTRTEGINNFVARVLFNETLLMPIQAELAKQGYRIAGVTVEKVLVGSFRELPFYQGKIAAGLVPYDAMVWFRLQKN